MPNRSQPNPQIILEQYVQAFEDDFGRPPEPTAYLVTADLYRMGECSDDDFPSFFEPEELVQFTKWCKDRSRHKNGEQRHEKNI